MIHLHQALVNVGVDLHDFKTTITLKHLQEQMQE
jgi:hypothetical protein